jgi:hypothetical protein
VPELHTPAQNQFLEQMSVTLCLIFSAVAHERYMTRTGQRLEQAQCELLTMVLDAATARIDRPIQEELRPVATREPGPRYSAGQVRLEQSLAGPQRRHPDVIACGRHTAATETSRKNPETIGLAIDRAPDGFGS